MLSTYEYHLTCGVGGVEVPCSTYLSSGTPTFGVQELVVHIHIHTISINYLALIRPNSFLRHSLYLIPQGPVFLQILGLSPPQP